MAGAALPDRANHGGQDYLPWVLNQLHQSDLQTGQRSLDVFTVHWYPQGSQALGLQSEAFSNDVSANMSNLRNRSTRSLWDPNYTRRELGQQQSATHSSPPQLGEC